MLSDGSMGVLGTKSSAGIASELLPLPQAPMTNAKAIPRTIDADCLAKRQFE